VLFFYPLKYPIKKAEKRRKTRNHLFEKKKKKFENDLLGGLNFSVGTNFVRRFKLRTQFKKIKKSSNLS